MEVKQQVLVVLVLVLCVYSLGIFTRTIGFTIISNTSGQSPIGGNATVVNFCQVAVSTKQTGTDFSEDLTIVDLGSLFAAGAMGTPRRVVLSANQTGNRRINVSINGTDWQCVSGTCTAGEEVTGQNCTMPVGVTHFLNETADPGTTYSSTDLDESSEYDSAYILTSASSPIQIYPQINSTTKWTNQTYWFNVKCPDNTSAGTYQQNVTFAWDCS